MICSSKSRVDKLDVDQQSSNQQQQQEPSEESSSYDRPKRNPFCSRCRNHGKSAQVKGHKRHCEYRDCQCGGCKLVECRQIVSAAQIKRRRYQKQDEECGRRIEVSPPLLTRKSDVGDPAALIAKTLIGSATTAEEVKRHIQQQQIPVATTTQLPGHLHQAIQTITNNTPTTLSQLHNLNSHHSYNPDIGDNHNLNNNKHLSKVGRSRLEGSPASLASLTNALHLFHFPGSMLSAAGSFAGLHHPIHPIAARHHHHHSTMATSTSLLMSSSTESAAHQPLQLTNREQLNLVEEIHQAFGPLAVYAWLRAEQFDLQKVTDLIELSRVPFEELLRFSAHSPLDLTSPIVD